MWPSRTQCSVVSRHTVTISHSPFHPGCCSLLCPILMDVHYGTAPGLCCLTLFSPLETLFLPLGRGTFSNAARLRSRPRFPQKPKFGITASLVHSVQYIFAGPRAPARQMVVRIKLCPCPEGREDPENQPNRDQILEPLPLLVTPSLANRGLQPLLCRWQLVD